MYCRKCGELIDDNAVVCPKCGEKQVDGTKETVFCKHCGEEIDADCIICPKCGKQVQEVKTNSPNIVINNSNENNNSSINTVAGLKYCNKTTSLLLCFFLGVLGAHKFYEGKIGMGILYLFTLGLFGFGVIIDFIKLLGKPNPYAVV